MIGIFSSGCLVQEDFSKNRIFCSFAAADMSCTVGFTVAASTKPMTLLKGNQLDAAKAQPLTLVLRRKRGESSFEHIVCGTVDDLVTYAPSLTGMLSESLQSMVDEAVGDDTKNEGNSESTQPTGQESD